MYITDLSYKHPRSDILRNDQLCDPPTHSPQKRICKNEKKYKTPSHPPVREIVEFDNIAEFDNQCC